MYSQPHKLKINAEKARKYGIFQRYMYSQNPLQSVSQTNKTPLCASDTSPGIA